MPMIHCVYFTLHDASPARVEGLIRACKQSLTDHPGTTYFAVGPRNPAFARPVNDQDFDVCLVISFDSKESHDLYQTAPRHDQFIDEQKANWKQVRVFDADC
jgi:hypothetical protein